VVVSGGSVDLPAVQGQWKLFLTRVGQRSRRLQALLREAVPTQCLDNVITLKFRQQYHFTGVDDPSARREVEGVLSQILGQPVKIICVLDEEVTARNVARPTARTAETVTDADLTELFPGWEINET